MQVVKMKKSKIRTGDFVVVISGKNKGAKGTVFSVDKKANKVRVKGVNIVKLHKKPTAQSEGGILKKEAAIHISNVMLFDKEKDKGSKASFKKDKDGVKVRMYKKTGNEVKIDALYEYKSIKEQQKGKNAKS